MTLFFAFKFRSRGGLTTGKTKEGTSSPDVNLFQFASFETKEKCFFRLLLPSASGMNWHSLSKPSCSLGQLYPCIRLGTTIVRRICVVKEGIPIYEVTTTFDAASNMQRNNIWNTAGETTFMSLEMKRHFFPRRPQSTVHWYISDDDDDGR